VCPGLDSLNLAPLAIEICGGIARLTKCLGGKGLDAVAVDWVRNRSKPVGPNILLDLTTTSGQQVLDKARNSGRVAYAHAAPPCGTASRAKEIPLANSDTAR
jgi:hypothetical protein